MKGYENGEYRPNATLTYAEALQLITKSFQLAAENDIKLADSLKVSDSITREQFAGWIIDEFDRIGVYPVKRMYIHIADIEQITPDYAGKVQTLLLTDITSLPETQMFRPQDAITRSEAADWLADAVRFAEQLRANQERNLVADSSFEYDANRSLTEP